ncbi:MAG: N-acetyltransferase [Bacteroidetes bacterium]|nr:N-acetyltransferase [Bacteroidota bacterium]
MLNIRKANEDDLERIREIYNDAVLTSTSTFDTEVKSSENRRSWFLDRDENFPVFVAVLSNCVVGYIALNKWSERLAYNITAEVSLYVHKDFRAQGIGKQLLEKCVTYAQEATELNSLIARITEGNAHSIYLHKLNGFELMGIMKQAGRKFDKLHDVTFMQKMLR